VIDRVKNPLNRIPASTIKKGSARAGPAADLETQNIVGALKPRR